MLLTVAQLKEHIPSLTIPDTAIQRMLDWNESAITARLGAPGARTERVFVRGWATLLMLERAPVSITSVKEFLATLDEVTLDPTDYRLTGNTLIRLETGPHGQRWWGGPVEVVYVPRDDTLDRTRVQVELCKLDASHEPALQSYTTGKHSETYRSSTGDDAYDAAREAILDSLETTRPIVFA